MVAQHFIEIMESKEEKKKCKKNLQRLYLFNIINTQFKCVVNDVFARSELSRSWGKECICCCCRKNISKKIPRCGNYILIRTIF